MADLGGFMDAAYGLMANLIWLVVIVVIAAVGFFGARYYGNKKKQAKAYNITAFVSNPDGSHYVDLIGKFTVESMELMKFKNYKNETMPVINPNLIVDRSVQLFRYGSSQYAVIPPTVYRNIDTKKFEIDLIDLDMLAFKGLEQRQAISRWQKTKDQIQQWAPWITILGCLILGGVVIWFITAYGMYMWDKITAARMADCGTFIKNTAQVISNNATSPI